MSEMFLQKDKLEILAQFFQNENQKVCFLKGLAGLFKTSLVKKSIETIKDDYLIFNVKCFFAKVLSCCLKYCIKRLYSVRIFFCKTSTS